jgi:Golgi transport complex subunit 5
MNESKVPADFKPDPYADYASLLSPAFTPSAHANVLVLATNDPSDTQADLTSPMKRIEYDLDEVNRRIDELVHTHTHPGISNGVRWIKVLKS